MKQIEDILSKKINKETLNKKLFVLYKNYKHNPVCLSVLINIEKYKNELLGYQGFHKAPVTSNLIESFNSHLEARLFALRGFNNFSYARLWLNGYILKRRFTKFTDCRFKFKNLNGKSGVEQTKKERINLPPLF